MKYRKKPVEIEAFPVREALRCAARDWKNLPVWLSEAYEQGLIIFANKFVIIKTLEGDHRGDIDDMIIRGIKGELYPCKSDVFSLTYEKVDG